MPSRVAVARWPGRGSGANVAAGGGVLGENASFTNRFYQSFNIPAGTTALQFTITGATFGSDPNNPPDALEVALLNYDSGLPLVGAAQGLTLTDALLNIQADGTTYFGNKANVSGVATSGIGS